MNGTDRIELRGIRVMGVHGLLEEERVRAQPFEIDLDVETDLSRAGRSDELVETVDYGAIAETAAAVVAGPHVDLIERLAEKIASAILALGRSEAVSVAPNVTAVAVTVRKLRPPVAVQMSSAGVTIVRVQGDPPDGGHGR